MPEAAELLGIGTSKLWELVMAAEIESVRIGRARRISRRALDNFIAEAADVTEE